MMGTNIQAMSGHCLKLLVCLLVLMNAQVHGFDNVSVTIVWNAVEKGAVCLDGSPPAYYYDKGYGEGADNWVIFLRGGEWCYNEADCVSRFNYSYGLGSSAKINTTGGNLFNGILSQSQSVNPDLYNWNRVYVVYCDGASFSGDKEEVNPETNVHRRGARIFNAIIKELLTKGMKKANNAILAGQSAGGLGVMLHCDQFRAQIPNTKRVKCLSDAGFFIHGKDIPKTNKAQIEQPYSNIVAYHGMYKLLRKSCTSKMDAKSCLYPENFVRDIKTPLFLVNSAFDAFQMPLKVHNDQPTWINCLSNLTSCEPTHIRTMNDFRTAFIRALPKSDPSIGMFIDSCYIHDHILYDGRWNSPRIPLLKKKTIAKAFGDWFFGRSCFQAIDSASTPRTCRY